MPRPRRPLASPSGLSEVQPRGAAASAANRRAGKVPPDFSSIDGRLYSEAEREFLAAVDAYCQKHDRRFPSNSELFAVLLSLGYRKADPCSPP